ncbi:DUF1707 domain-containing protein [Dactylosporangium sp. NPDC006015]|uniref:DUF1707 SHOCT-like domain-containing protein n=1 Tax=Dactylosporangium sp. NPDC006015 TaxID=3154576 RepID=UPI0033B64508
MAGERVRASDKEREQYADMVRAGMTEGRLTLEEGEERLAQVYAAKFRDELPPVTADLPDGGRRGLFELPETQAEFLRQGRRHLARHGAFVAVLAVALTGLWALSGAHFFWPAIPLFFLVLSVFRHARWRRWAASGGAPWSGGPPWGRRHWGHGHGHGPWAAASDRHGWS